MQSFGRFVNEGREGSLYHGTTVIKTAFILYEEVMLPHDFRTFLQEPGSDNLRGVSFTRSMQFAKAWAVGNYGFADFEPFSSLKRLKDHAPSSEPCVLEFDYRKMSANYRIEAYNDFPSTRHRRTHSFMNQMEEKLIGEFKNPDRYLKAIHVSRHYDPNDVYYGVSNVPHKMRLVEQFVTQNPKLIRDL